MNLFSSCSMTIQEWAADLKFADREEFAAALEGKAPPHTNQRSAFDDLMDL